MGVTLFSTKCPKCNVLEKKLNAANIRFEEVNDTEAMLQKGFTSAPMLEVDGVVYDFKEAVEWIEEQ